MYRISDSPSKQHNQICLLFLRTIEHARAYFELTLIIPSPRPGYMGPSTSALKNDHPIMSLALAFLILRDIKPFYRILYFCLCVEEQRPRHPNVTSTGILFFFFGSVSYKKHVTYFCYGHTGTVNLKSR